MERRGLEEDIERLDALIGYLHVAHRLDLSCYKRSFLSRSVRRRMRANRMDTVDRYLGLLQSDPDETRKLLDAILINVTGFFRDHSAWAGLTTHLERRLQAKPNDAPLRVWCAGCASGEEAYTVAIVLSELLGPECVEWRVKFFATDADSCALAVARRGRYPSRALDGIPVEIVDKYFVCDGDVMVATPALRRLVVFGAGDLVHDPPISRIDLLSCRNTMMYLDPTAQGRVLGKLAWALADGGLLFVGQAETLNTRPALFHPVDLSLRIFTHASPKNPPANHCRPLWSIPMTMSDTFDSDVNEVDTTPEHHRSASLEAERMKDQLQSTIEELETANEELESANEELIAANEELDVMNAQLAAANGELQSMNEELERRTGELSHCEAARRESPSSPVESRDGRSLRPQAGRNRRRELLEPRSRSPTGGRRRKDARHRARRDRLPSSRPMREPPRPITRV